MLKLDSVDSLLQDSWKTFKKGFWSLILVKLAQIGIYLAIAVLFLALTLPGTLSELKELRTYYNLDTASVIDAIAGSAAILIPVLLLFLAFLLISFWGSAAQMVAVRDLDKKMKVRDIYKLSGKNLSGFAWIHILVSLITLIGLMLFIIPGIIFMVWLSFSAYVFIWDGISGVNALKKSQALVAGYFWAVLGRVLLLMIISMAINFLISLAAPILYLPLVAFSEIFVIIYYVNIFNNLKKIKNNI